MAKKPSSLLLVTLLGLALAVPAQADLRAGVNAFSRGDYPRALQEFQPLAEQGDAEAQVRLGVMYDMGLGTPLNHEAGAEWFRKAAEQGHLKAQYLFGSANYQGKGVSQDYPEAAKWFRRAAAQGLVEAQIMLGAMYAKGEGVPQDYVKAHAFFNVAAAQGNERAGKNRDIVAESMSPEDIAKARRLARECAAKNHKGCDF